MKHLRGLWSALVLAVCLPAGCVCPVIAGSSGALRVCSENPRYFCDADGEPVYLTGSHVWNNLVDMSADDPPAPFDFPAYLEWMSGLNHNFIRMWAWELVNWDRQTRVTVAPHPWARTGPGAALDGKPRFDLRVFDEAYFDRLRRRLEQAKEHRIYVSIMLFEGWGTRFSADAWENHPFHPDNNVNVAGFTQARLESRFQIHTLEVPELTEIQEAYVRKLVDTVNDLDNVLYEICNEAHAASTNWQYHMIDFVHAYEQGLPNQHPVGMTFQFDGGTDQTLFDSPADWISPGPSSGYRDDPPSNDGRKVILNDTDHLWGIGGNADWVWMSFLRGLNPIFMDPYDGQVLGNPFDPQWEPIRLAMGYTRTVAERIDLKHMTPRNGLASTGFCLANPGIEYLVYLPDGGSVEVTLTDVATVYAVEWFDPDSGEFLSATPRTGAGTQTFTSPLGNGAAVLHLNAT